MTSIRTLVVMICMLGVTAAFAQTTPNAAKAAPTRVAPAEAKNHVGEMAIVCGKVVDAKIADPGVGPGKQVYFYLDEPQTDPVFFFVAWGTQAGGPQEAVAAYQGKQVCVTGKIATFTGKTFIMAPDRSQIKVQPEKAGNK